MNMISFNVQINYFTPKLRGKDIYSIVNLLVQWSRENTDLTPLNESMF